MTAQNIFDLVKAILDEYSRNGVATPEDKTKDIELKSIPLMNAGQKELYDLGNNIETFTYIGTNFKNELTDGFDIKTFTGTDITTDGVLAKAYYFEVDDDATVYLEELIGSVWTVKETLTCTSSNGFTAYKGSITTSRQVRLRFSGTTFYRYNAVAMWNIPFKTIPNYGRWIKIELPSNFVRVADVVQEDSDYVNQGDYYLEGQKDLYISYDFEGELRIQYYAVPDEITSLDDDIVIDPIHANMLAYYIVFNIAPNEQPELTNLAREEYLRLRAQLFKPLRTGFSKIETSFGKRRHI